MSLRRVLTRIRHLTDEGAARHGLAIELDVDRVRLGKFRREVYQAATSTQNLLGRKYDHT